MELIRYYYTAYGLTIGSEIILLPLQEIAPKSVDLVIKRGQLLNPPYWQSTKIYRAGLQARFAQNGPDQFWLDWSPMMSFMARQGNELVLDTEQIDVDLISLFTLSEAIGLILFQKGYFLLHGSAIQVNNEGVVFLGEPGAGKSTTVAAFAQKGVSVINDDMVCILISEAGQPFLIPSFPQIKIWGNSVAGLQVSTEHLGHVREGVDKFSWQQPGSFAQQAVPLKQIFVLTPPQRTESTYSQLPKNQVPVELLRYFPLADGLLYGQALKTYFEQSVVLANTAPVVRMSRPVDFVSLYAFVDRLKNESIP